MGQAVLEQRRLVSDLLVVSTFDHAWVQASFTIVTYDPQNIFIVQAAVYLPKMLVTKKKRFYNIDTWLPTGTLQTNARVPVGGGVDYYCQNLAKRPKLDQVLSPFPIHLLYPESQGLFLYRI
jgi:hypothetical protein